MANRSTKMADWTRSHRSKPKGTPLGVDDLPARSSRGRRPSTAPSSVATGAVSTRDQGCFAIGGHGSSTRGVRAALWAAPRARRHVLRLLLHAESADFGPADGEEGRSIQTDGAQRRNPRNAIFQGHQAMGPYATASPRPARTNFRTTPKARSSF